MMADRLDDPGLDPVLPRARRGITRSESGVILGIMAVLLLFLLMVIAGPRPGARRSQCQNNLKLIALALHNYEQVHHALPPVYTVDASGRPLHSWRTLVLPFMEQEALYRSIDLTKSWDDPANAHALRTVVPWYHCPSLPGPEFMTTYFGIATPDGCFPPGRSRTSEEITDDRSSTLMVIEGGVEHAAPWMAPVDAGERLVLGLGPDTKFAHPFGSNLCFADASVWFMYRRMRPEALRSMISVSGHETVPVNPW